MYYLSCLFFVILIKQQNLWWDTAISFFLFLKFVILVLLFYGWVTNQTKNVFTQNHSQLIIRKAKTIYNDGISVVFPIHCNKPKLQSTHTTYINVRLNEDGPRPGQMSRFHISTYKTYLKKYDVLKNTELTTIAKYKVADMVPK